MKSLVFRVLVHGFRDGPTGNVNEYGRSAFLQKGNYNIIVLDWSKGANTLNYLEARNRIDGVGRVTAKFLEYMLQVDPNVQLSKMAMIGHSLGAHVGKYRAQPDTFP